MTHLQIRTIDFDLDGTIPFQWNPSNPAFSVQMNAVSIIAIAFEKFIVAATREAIPLITDPEAKEEAQAFLEQEAQHSMAHRRHVASLIRSYPGLQETLDGANALYDKLTAEESLEFRLAYIADLEASFTPFFKLLLDHEDELFRTGDERVASLLLWHFVEEVEHRSSGLIVYNAVVPSKLYRTRVLPRVTRHVQQLSTLIFDGFNKHVPASERGIDATVLQDPNDTWMLRKQRLTTRFPRLAKLLHRAPDPFECVPTRERLVSFTRIMLAQLPGHDPVHQPLPKFADEWFAHYEAGGDVAHWYTSTGQVSGAGKVPESALGFHALQIAAVDRLNDESIAVTFEVPAELADTYRFVQGQHVSVRAVIQGEDVRRTYSICSTPGSGVLRVAIKRMPGGLFSGWALDNLRVGTALEVAPPAGRFHVALDAAARRHFVAVAGGSGIGPVMSLLATTLDVEPESRFTLLYANRTAGSVMFDRELETLVQSNAGRLRVVHVLEDVDGFIDLARLEAWREDGTLQDVSHWFVCGPNAMADAIVAALAELHVDAATVHAESYTAGEMKTPPLSAAASRHADASLSVAIDGAALSVPTAGRTVLDAALSTGADVPWSCRSGICGTCRAKVCAGTVEMAYNDVLSEDELAEGFVLTCQSRPTSDHVLVDYDARSQS